MVKGVMEVHVHMVKFRLPHVPIIRNHLITLYSQWRQFGHAQKLVEEGYAQRCISYSKLLSQCIASKVYIRKQHLAGHHFSHAQSK